jgi:hypothetical protein
MEKSTTLRSTVAALSMAHSEAPLTPAVLACSSPSTISVPLAARQNEHPKARQSLRLVQQNTRDASAAANALRSMRSLFQTQDVPFDCSSADTDAAHALMTVSADSCASNDSNSRASSECPDCSIPASDDACTGLLSLAASCWLQHSADEADDDADIFSSALLLRTLTPSPTSVVPQHGPRVVVAKLLKKERVRAITPPPKRQKVSKKRLASAIKGGSSSAGPERTDGFRQPRGRPPHDSTGRRMLWDCKEGIWRNAFTGDARVL